MITQTTIKKALRDWVIDCSGMAAAKVVWSHQSEMRPHEPYLSLQIINQNNSVFSVPNKNTIDTGVLQIKDEQELTLSCSFIGETLDNVNRLNMAVEDPYYEMRGKQTNLITVGAVVAGAYTVTVLGKGAGYVAGGAETQEDIRDALVIAINAESFLSGLGITAENGSTTDTLIISGQYSQEFPASVTSNMTEEKISEAIDISPIRVELSANVPTKSDKGWKDNNVVDIRLYIQQTYFREDVATITSVDFDIDID